MHRMVFGKKVEHNGQIIRMPAVLKQNAGDLLINNSKYRSTKTKILDDYCCYIIGR